MSHSFSDFHYKIKFLWNFFSVSLGQKDNYFFLLNLFYDLSYLNFLDIQKYVNFYKLVSR